LARSSDKKQIGRLLGTFNSGGKMLRPGLLLLAGASCGGITDKHVEAGAIVELIHNATLLHDDVMDEGQRRRGEATVNSVWGNERAVILGDFLLSRVFEMCAGLEPEVIKMIAGTTVRICEGELRQIGERENWELSEAEYIEIITEKSASLFSCCCRLGGILAGASEAQAGILGDFGLNAGIAFQIMDDLVDIVGDERQAGKSLGSDVDKSKLTLAVIHLLRTVSGGEVDIIRRELSGSGSGKKGPAELLKSYGSLEYSRNRGGEYVTKAVASLGGLKDSDAKEALIEAAKFMGGW
jgi:octaprenyl-diphosphate synthase